METVGKFEFNRKDLIGHGAFAVVFKGRHKEKRDWVVAVKCINKKNLAKSQSLLGKEIKILKELKHENIVRLLDFQYCNGGDLAEYLHSKGTLSEDTIRVFLQQIGQAMKVLQSKDILHRDLKPQNILLCHPEGRRSSPINTSIKIADFGFARHLQTNTMAATLCGSPMYMVSHSISKLCLSGHSTPQELRLFYESNMTVLPSIPKETSSNLRHLMLGLLQRNHKERIGFDEFFHHPFLEKCSSTKKCMDCILLVFLQLQNQYRCCSRGPNTSISVFFVFTASPVHVISFPSSGSVSSSSSSPTSQLTSPQVRTPVAIVVRKCSPSAPIPVPTQIHNYQRLEQNLQSVGLHGSTRHVLFSCLISAPASVFNGSIFIILRTLVGMTSKTSEQSLPLSTITGLLAGSPDRQDTSSPKVSFQTSILPGRQCTQHAIFSELSFAFQQQVKSRTPMRIRTVLDLQSLDPSPASQINLSPKSANKNVPFRRSLSTGRLSDMLLKAAFGAHLFEEDSDESLTSEKSLDITGSIGTNRTTPPTGRHRGFQYSDSPPPAVFIMGSQSRGNTPPDATVPRMFSGSPSYINSAWLLNSRLLQGGSRRNSETEAMDATPHSSLVFHPPELPEETLMEQAHTDELNELRFTVAFVHCVMELALSKDSGLDAISSPDISFLEQSLVTDQISLLSREWGYAEQLVLYMKAEEFLSSALHSAKETIKQGRLLPSATVKQVIRKLNELYKSCVTYCRTLNHRLQTFLLDKQKLIDRFNGLTAEKLIYSHTVHMVQCAALDEMFHYGTASVQRYHKALLLMEGLSRIITEQKDIDSIEKCKQCIERRLSALRT
uniref:non-specific serine/threonine protein kinase n=1 Tax=Cyclopterus lumpus TaxID=8103 RepID=A0A8C3A203_CYCLU